MTCLWLEWIPLLVNELYGLPWLSAHQSSTKYFAKFSAYWINYINYARV